MPHKITIAGRETSLAWSKSTSRIMRFRLSGIGFDWDKDTDPKRMPATMVKLCWALLPAERFEEYATPESMLAAMSEEEDEGLLKAANGIIAEMVPSDEKKSTLTNSPSPESSLE